MAASWPDGPYLLHHGQKSPSSPLLKICSHLRLPLAIAGTLVAPPAFSCPFLLSSSPLNSPFYTTPASSFWLSGRKQKLKKNTGTHAAEMISALRAAGRRGGGGWAGSQRSTHCHHRTGFNARRRAGRDIAGARPSVT
jgi:hypothetical protein